MISLVLDTNGAFRYEELKALPLDEYFRIHEEIQIIDTMRRKLEAKDQKAMALKDPHIVRKLV